MARKALIVKAQKEPKYMSRKLLRCMECGRSRAVHHNYLLCRIHLREYICNGLLAGFRKSSW